MAGARDLYLLDSQVRVLVAPLDVPVTGVISSYLLIESELGLHCFLIFALFSGGRFEGVSWNQDETQIAYIAEEPAPDRPVYGRRQAAKGTDEPGSEKKAAGNDAGTWKGRGDWVEDWGERYTGKQRPLVYVLDIARYLVPCPATYTLHSERQIH